MKQDVCYDDKKKRLNYHKHMFIINIDSFESPSIIFVLNNNIEGKGERERRRHREEEGDRERGWLKNIVNYKVKKEKMVYII